MSDAATTPPTGERPVVPPIPEPTVKRGRGRPRKDAKPPEPPPPPMDVPVGVCGAAWGSIFATVGALTKCPDIWELTEEEQSALDEVTIPVVKQYLPALMAEHAALIVLCVALSGTVGTRIVQTRQARIRLAENEGSDGG